MSDSGDPLTFVLVHGAWHGGWCFDRLASELDERGYPQNSSSLWLEPYPPVDVPPEKRVYIAGTQDLVVTLPWARHVARTRLGVDPIELPFGHSSFLSHPGLLADTLVQQVA